MTRHTGRTRAATAALLALALTSGAVCARAADVAALAAKVRAREEAFAKTMADRDLAAFATFVDEEAVFLGRTELRGRPAVVEGWKRYFEGKTAPFSWKPDRVHVVDSGALAVSQGPVFDPEGQRSGTFTSTWRLGRDGEWRVVLDSGCPPCACGPDPAKEKK
jgi:ketosteroid isomerase-like protein